MSNQNVQPQVLKCKPFARFVMVFALIADALWMWNAYHGSLDSRFLNESILSILFFGILCFSFWRDCLLKVTLFPDRIEWARGLRTTQILFSDINVVHVFFPSVMTLAVIRSKTAKALWLNTGLFDANPIFETIARFRPSLIDKNRYFILNATINHSDQAFERVRFKIKDWRFFLMKYLVFPLLLTIPFFLRSKIYCFDFFAGQAVLVGCATAVFGFMFYMLEELILLRQLQKNASKVGVEAGIHRRIQFLYFLCMMGLAGTAFIYLTVVRKL